MTILQRLNEVWKGYSQADIDSLHLKLSTDEALRPDGIIEVTARELRALCAESIEAAALKLEQRGGNSVYRAAWRSGAKTLREMKN